MKNLITTIRKYRIKIKIKKLMNNYIQAVSSISDDFDPDHAELVCPSLKKYRQDAIKYRNILLAI